MKLFKKYSLNSLRFKKMPSVDLLRVDLSIVFTILTSCETFSCEDQRQGQELVISALLLNALPTAGV